MSAKVKVIEFILWFCLTVVIILLLIGVLISALCNRERCKSSDGSEFEKVEDEERAAVVVQDELAEFPTEKPVERLVK